MISNSPDPFLQVRLFNSQVKSTNFNLQSMEFKCHSTTICDYQMEMLHHLLTVESKTLPSMTLIEQQPEIKLGMRPLLLDFLMEVITILNLSRSTFPLTVNLIDRYCSTRIVKKQHYQLLGLTSLWISCKNLDSKFKIPTLNDLRKICVDSYYKELFIEMEKHILKSLEWMVNSPTFDAFIDLYLNLLISNNNNPSVCDIIRKSIHNIKLLSNYIGELFQFYPNIYFDYTSSQIALIAILASIMTLKIPVNLISLLNFYNDLLKTDEYKSNACGDEADNFDEILSINSFQSLFTKGFLKNLIKIIDNPPKSLEIKYFSEKGKYTQLMKSLVQCAIDSLMTLLDPPVTPKVEIPEIKQPTTFALPLTPVSNSTSPRRFKSEKPDDEGTTADATAVNASGTITPVSLSSPNKKRGYDSIDELEIATSTIEQYQKVEHDEFKKSKGIFFIPR
ncbi:G1 cyclin [Spathaspora passalidarum NRRL Y-27907]|uniref:G1 cyclin n=1 Tax=Spathaspora passalidarum (strain NRRL Y-27907 / 11-Y1) TaxID=619300 RepID=G3ANH5_SPAPN|nr:G1 cyclin [Spathaspora passalidarum NRRL Y-27907]EGW31964.1 G1 cyclin [Spathaspora passalidarum NRRL Y-27907]